MAPVLSPHPLPSLLDKCFSLSVGTLERLWRLMRPVFCIKKWGKQNIFFCTGVPRDSAHFQQPDFCPPQPHQGATLSQQQRSSKAVPPNPLDLVDTISQHQYAPKKVIKLEPALHNRILTKVVTGSYIILQDWFRKIENLADELLIVMLISNQKTPNKWMNSSCCQSLGHVWLFDIL